VWIVKLGGSLAQNPALKDWLEVLACDGAGRVVVVPGGGPLADTVRGLHRHWNLPDPVAHRMALLAMEQYGLLLAGLQPRLRAARTAAEIAEILAQGAAAVWLPFAMTTGPEAQDIKESWNMTSDSLTAWFAAQIKARRLVFVKSLEPAAEPVGVDELARTGLVDPLFPVYARRSGCEVWWSGSRQHGRMAQALGGLAEPGTRVLVR